MDPRDPLLLRLARLIGDVTGADPEKLSAASSSRNTSGWDSIANMSIIGLIEEELGVVIDTADAMRLSSLGDLARFVRERAPEARTGTAH